MRIAQYHIRHTSTATEEIVLRFFLTFCVPVATMSFQLPEFQAEPVCQKINTFYMKERNIQNNG